MVAVRFSPLLEGQSCTNLRRSSQVHIVSKVFDPHDAGPRFSNLHRSPGIPTDDGLEQPNRLLPDRSTILFEYTRPPERSAGPSFGALVVPMDAGIKH